MRKIGSHPTPDQQRDVTLKRTWLQDRVDAVQKQAANILQAASEGEDNSWDNALDRETYAGIEVDGIGEGEDMMSTLHSPKNAIKRRHPEIVLLMAAWMQSISRCILPHILGASGAIKVLLKT